MSANQAHVRLISAAATVVLLVFAFGRRHHEPSDLPLTRGSQSHLVLRRHVPLSLTTQPQQHVEAVADDRRPAAGDQISSQQLIKIQPTGRAHSRPATVAPTHLPATPPTVDDTVRYHRVVEGDTLPNIAHHYFGSPARFVDIFEANRDILTRPDLLPLGVRLVIPPRLVPVPRNVNRLDAAVPPKPETDSTPDHTQRPKSVVRVISDRDLLPVP